MSLMQVDWDDLGARMRQLQLRSRTLKEWSRELHKQARQACRIAEQLTHHTASLADRELQSRRRARSRSRV